jgi:hypothetical protein
MFSKGTAVHFAKTGLNVTFHILWEDVRFKQQTSDTTTHLQKTNLEILCTVHAIVSKVWLISEQNVLMAH